MSSRYFHKVLPPTSHTDDLHILGGTSRIVTAVPAFDESGYTIENQKYRIFDSQNEAIAYERRLPPSYRGRICTPTIRYADGSVLLLQQESRLLPAQEHPFEHVDSPQFWALSDLRRAFLQTYSTGLAQQRQCFTFCLAMLHNLVTIRATYSSHQFVSLTEACNGFNYLFHLATYLDRNANSHLYTRMTDGLQPNEIRDLINQGYAILLPIEKHTWLEHADRSTGDKRHAVILLRDANHDMRIIDQSGAYQLSKHGLKQLCSPDKIDSTTAPWHDQCLIIGVRKERHMLSDKELAHIIRYAHTETIVDPRTNNDCETNESKPSLDINIYEPNFQLSIENFTRQTDA